MVKKTNTQRVWARQKRQQEGMQEQEENNFSFDQNSQNDEQLDSFEEPLLEDYQCPIKQKNHQSRQLQQQISTQKVQNTNDAFLVTSDLINQLTEQVYKNIVLTEFIQTNHSYHQLKQKRKQLATDNFSQSQTAVKQNERQRIQFFVFQKSLGVPSYYKQFTSASMENQPIQPKCSKRNLLSYLNTVLFDVLNIKFLNIYGPTGSGKTYMLKSIFKHHSLEENVIWLNGMNILKGKTKRFLADIKNKVDSLMWEISQYCQSNTFFPNILDSSDEKILVIDEYDQASHFSITDLLRYAYLKQLQSKRRNGQNKIIQIFLISKVILVSNTFNTQINNTTDNQYDNISVNKNTLYVQNLIFRPFSQKQTQNILIQKINIVNIQFKEYLAKQNTIKSIFQENPQGVFTQQRLLIFIRKICFGDEVDIRKILLIISDSLKILIELLQQKLQQNQKKHIKKFKNFLIDDKFLLDIINGIKPKIDEVEEIPKVQKTYQTVEDDENPVVYYIFNLENEGKSILAAIHKQVMWKIKCDQQLKRSQAQLKTRAKDEISLQNRNKITQKISIESNKKTIIRVQNFYKKIRPRVQFTKLLDWLYQWQQAGVIKIRKDISCSSHFDCPKNLLTSQTKIRIMDNYQIEVLDKQSIEKGLQIY